jgi:hypothetical protein
MVWRSKVDKSQLHPGLVTVMDLAHKKLAGQNVPFKTYSGLRTFEQQNELYAMGRTVGEEGAIVTKAKGGQSMHNYGLAVDSAPLVDADKPQGSIKFPPASGAVWFELERALQEAAEEIDGEHGDGIDYEWGGRWKFRDVPHIQVRTTLGELRAGLYPYCADVEWLVKAHTTFLFDTPWMKRRIQFLLNMQSYDVGAVDGDFGRRSIYAHRLFSEHQGITMTGNLKTDNKAIVGQLVRLHQTAMSTPRGDSLIG